VWHTVSFRTKQVGHCNESYAYCHRMLFIMVSRGSSMQHIDHFYSGGDGSLSAARAGGGAAAV
jgi:hypothetical protein